MRISSRTSAAYRAPSAADVIRWLLIASLAWGGAPPPPPPPPSRPPDKPEG
jgi:hypothetical protein